MEIKLAKGKYVVAVSGGVDSVVLLDLLSKQKDIELVIAHFDHGIRKDSYKDCEFVEQLAEKYDLDFVGAGAELGKDASEEQARDARWQFLQNEAKNEKAKAILTAHHADDVLETVIFNILRGTGRRGVTSLDNRDNVLRPLLSYRKSEIINYAKIHNIKWREDSTNKDINYSRNWIRQNIIPKLSHSDIQSLLRTNEEHKPINKEVEELLSKFLNQEKNNLDRRMLQGTSHKISTEIIAHWLRQNDIREFDKKNIERIVLAAKTSRSGKTINVYGRNIVKIGDKYLTLEKKPR